MRPLGDGEGLGEGLGHLAEDLQHLLGRLVIKLRGGVFEAFRVVEGFPRADAQKDVVREGVLLAEIVAVVGRHERRVEALGQLHQPGEDLPLVGQSVVHQLDIEIVLAEDLPVSVQGPFGAGRVVAEEGAGHLAL